MQLSKKRVSKAIKNPILIIKFLKRKYFFYGKKYFWKDKISEAFANWFNDFGDSTLRLDYPLTPESTVLDLGGYKGDFAFEIYSKYECFVYVFEPVKRFYEECVERFRGNDKIRIFPYGLSNETKYAFISDEDNASSVVQNCSDQNEKILLVEFKEAVNELNIGDVDLLKINVEGSEFLILPHLIESGLIKRVHNLQVQFHIFYPNAKKLRKSLRKKLSKTHTEKWNYTFVWESWTLK
jgi:FkbM family methyltransferase